MRQIAFEANNLTTSTRRNTHNAPPDLRPKIARPSSNRLSHMHLSLADRYLGEPDYGLVGYRKLEHNLHVGRTKFYLNPSKQNPRRQWWKERTAQAKSARLAQIIAQVGRTAWAVLSFHHWRREFFWHLDDTHNAPPDLRRKIALPSFNNSKHANMVSDLFFSFLKWYFISNYQIMIVQVLELYWIYIYLYYHYC